LALATKRRDGSKPDRRERHHRVRLGGESDDAKPRKLVFVVAIALALSACGGKTTPPTASERTARGVANAYLTAWSDTAYERMCSYLTDCRPSGWGTAMRSFPVLVRHPRIASVHTVGNAVVVRYSIEMPELGSIICAAVLSDAERAAIVLAHAGKYVVWKDSLRLVPRKRTHAILMGSEKVRSNTLPRVASAIGAHVLARDETQAGTQWKMSFNEQVTSLLALYLSESGIPVESDEADAVIRDTAQECRSFYGRVRRAGG
jgi:hypothetical protein